MKIWPTKRVWMRIGVGLAILFGLVLTANGFMVWRTERQIQARFAAIRAAGDPAVISDLAPAPIPEDENAAVILQRLGPRLDAFSKDYAKFSGSPPGKAFDKRVDRGEAPTAEQIAAIRAILDQYSDVTAGLAEAVAIEKYASLADYSVDHQKFLDTWLKNEVGRIRTATRFLHWQSEVLLAEGKRDEAAQQGIKVLQLARLYDAEPLLVNYLVAIAIRGIAVNMLYDTLVAGPVTPATHAAIEKDLALHDTPQRVLHAIKTDRAFSGSVILEAGMGSIMGTDRPFYFNMVSWPIKRIFAGSGGYMDEQIAIIAKSWPNPNKNIGRSGADLGIMADLLQPALQAAYDAELRIVATMRALRVFNALSEYREANGKEATGLADLKLPAAATIDPHSNQPLLLKSTPEGWIVYSVMGNGKDDGGDFKGLKDFGVAPRTHRATE